MLSRLLRRIFLSQLLLGALLGVFFIRQTGASWWLAGAFALLVPLTLNLLLTSFGAVATALRSRAPGAPALWWRALWFEFLADIRVFWLQQPWALAGPVVQMPAAQALPSGAPSPVPVVLVHGYLCNHRVWNALSRQLRSAGHPVLCVDLEPLFTSIEEYAPVIEQAVSELCRQAGAEKVVLVGHSMGGLAIRAWIRAQGTRRVARVITLGTPHAGTLIINHPITPNGQQMVWHSPWLQALAASESPATRSLMRIALTPQDNIVYPQREQILSGAPVTVFDGLGHLELCLHKAVISWVLGQLPPR
jgi:triacylglycerol lipase